MSYSNYSFCVYDDLIFKAQDQKTTPNKSDKNKANKRI